MARAILGLTFAVAVLFPPSGLSAADPPGRAADLAPPVALTAAGTPIDVEGFAAPWLGDFDEDGRADLLVGQHGMGRLRVYRNTGTARQPRYVGFDWFRVAGRVTGVPNCCQVGFTPHLVDFDGDGRTDILTGSGFAELYLYRRNPDGSFAEAEVLEDALGSVPMGTVYPKESRLRYNSTAFAHDWDADGDLDLLLGRRRYGCLVNQGDRHQVRFTESLPLKQGGEPIPAGIVGPCVADWDGDGCEDLIVGRDSDVVWYRNTGSRRQPVLGPPQTLLAANGFRFSDGVPEDRPAYYHAVCVADYNADGRVDLLLGDNCREIVERLPLEEWPPEQQATRAEWLAERNRILSEIRDLRRRPDDEPRAARIERFRELLRKYQQLPPYLSTGTYGQRHGRVWLYLRRTAAS